MAGRRMPLAGPARAAIRDSPDTLGPIRGLSESSFITGRSSGRPLHRVQAHPILVAFAEACDIDPTRISTHTLKRTSVARVWRASKDDLIKTQRIAGRSSPLTTTWHLERFK
jgi:hypothetical protein